MIAPAPTVALTPVRHNVILFVPDGLRAVSVSRSATPEMDRLRRAGVAFPNSHAIFPTFTTANASAMATGHLMGDTGDFANAIYAGYQVAAAGRSVTPFLESDPVIADADEHFAGNYLDEETILAAAHDAGYDTASIGKVGPAAIFDAADVSGARTVVIDDSTGRTDRDGDPAGRAVRADLLGALRQATGSVQAPARGANGSAGDATLPGTTVANVAQQNWFLRAATKAVLPAFKASGKPFVLVFWSRDPDGTQHNQGDSPGRLTPGINGPTSLAAIRNADDDLGALRTALRDLNLEQTTDVIVASDHGSSTISKRSTTSPSTRYELRGIPLGALPPGFLALDLASMLEMPLSDPDDNDVVVHPDTEHTFPSRGDGLIGLDATQPEVVVAANGGSDLIYLPQPDAAELAPKIVAFLLAQDYVSGLFIDARLGRFGGTLPLSSIGLDGTAITPHPAIVVSFASSDTGCGEPRRCAVEVADSTLQQGQGMHGSSSSADIGNFIAAYGPDFKRRFTDPAPVSNADVGVTIARILGLQLASKGRLVGRAFVEAMPGGEAPPVSHSEEWSSPGPGGVVTILRYEFAAGLRYVDAAGFRGRTVGL